MPTKPSKKQVITDQYEDVHKLKKKRQERSTATSFAEINTAQFFADHLAPAFSFGPSGCDEHNKKSKLPPSLIFSEGLESSSVVLERIRSRQCSLSCRVSLHLNSATPTLASLQQLKQDRRADESSFRIASISVSNTESLSLKQIKMEVVIVDMSVGCVRWEDHLVTVMFLQKGRVSVSGLTVKNPQQYPHVDLHQACSVLAKDLVVRLLSTPADRMDKIHVTSNVSLAVFCMLPHSIAPEILKEYLEEAVGTRYVGIDESSNKNSFWISLDSQREKKLQVSKNCETILGCTKEPAKLYSRLWFVCQWLHEAASSHRITVPTRKAIPITKTSTSSSAAASTGVTAIRSNQVSISNNTLATTQTLLAAAAALSFVSADAASREVATTATRSNEPKRCPVRVIFRHSEACANPTSNAITNVAKEEVTESAHGGDDGITPSPIEGLINLALQSSLQAAIKLPETLEEAPTVQFTASVDSNSLTAAATPATVPIATTKSIPTACMPEVTPTAPINMEIGAFSSVVINRTRAQKVNTSAFCSSPTSSLCDFWDYEEDHEDSEDEADYLSMMNAAEREADDPDFALYPSRRKRSTVPLKAARTKRSRIVA